MHFIAVEVRSKFPHVLGLIDIQWCTVSLRNHIFLVASESPRDSLQGISRHVACSPFPRRYSLRTNENIWPLLPLVVLVVGFPHATRGDNRYHEKLPPSEGGGITPLKPVLKVLRTTVFIPFKGGPTSRLLKDSSIIPAELPLFKPRSPSSPLIFLALRFAVPPPSSLFSPSP